jgi:hypothetical protein
VTLEVPHSTRRRQAFPPFAALESLEQLPTRRPPTAPERSSPVQWERVGVDRYEVRIDTQTLGFIDVVGAVFVVLAGSQYDRATETSQTLVFDEAISALVPDE